jgi:hypothetical protein
VIADLKGKTGHIRTVLVPQWVKAAVDVWSTAAGITRRHGVPFHQQVRQRMGSGMMPKVLWEVVKGPAIGAGMEKLASHDLRLTCARLWHLRAVGPGTKLATPINAMPVLEKGVFSVLRLLAAIRIWVLNTITKIFENAKEPARFNVLNLAPHIDGGTM